MVSPAFLLPLPLVYGDIHSSTGIASVSAGIAGHRGKWRAWLAHVML